MSWYLRASVHQWQCSFFEILVFLIPWHYTSFYPHNWLPSYLCVSLLTPTWRNNFNVNILEVLPSWHTLHWWFYPCSWPHLSLVHQWLITNYLHQHLLLIVSKSISNSTHVKAQFMFTAFHNHHTIHLTWWPSKKSRQAMNKCQTRPTCFN